MGKGVCWKLKETGICPMGKDRELGIAEGMERKRWGRDIEKKRKEK